MIPFMTFLWLKGFSFVASKTDAVLLELVKLDVDGCVAKESEPTECYISSCTPRL